LDGRHLRERSDRKEDTREGAYSSAGIRHRKEDVLPFRRVLIRKKVEGTEERKKNTL